jgi:hypothetical protein
MSAHFSVLREADLVTFSKAGTTITYYLNLSVLEEALLEFTSPFGIQPIQNGISSSSSSPPKEPPPFPAAAGAPLPL